MTTLILGCGYLGRRVGRILANRGERVVGTVRSAERAAGLASWGVEPVLADVLHPETLDALPSAERLVYCVGFDRKTGSDMRDVYVKGLARVLDRLPCPPRSFVYASSTGVYGDSAGAWIDEETEPAPQTDSGRVCLEAETLLRERTSSWTPVPVMIRLAGLYGPGRLPRREPIMSGSPIAATPDTYLNMIHIDDAARVVVAALDQAGPGRLYLACDDRPVTRREFYERIASTLGAPPPVFAPPAPGVSERRRGETNKRASNRRMKAELGVSLVYSDTTVGIPAALAEETKIGCAAGGPGVA